MLKQRIITAVILAPLAIAAIFLLPLPFFHLVMTAICLVGAWEWSGLASQEMRTRKLQLGGFGLAMAGLFIWLPHAQMAELIDNQFTTVVLSVAMLWWIAALVMVLRYPRSAKLWRSQPASVFLFGLLTILPFLWAVVTLRSWHYEAQFYEGGWLLLYVMLLTWGADTGAFFCGKRWGKRKLAPQVSPGKTIEGLIGGVATALVIALVFPFLVTLTDISHPVLMVASVFAVLASALGDLCESMFKRSAGIKDSGTILPGHGGILDRIDSLTAAVPVFSLIFIVFG